MLNLFSGGYKIPGHCLCKERSFIERSSTRLLVTVRDNNVTYLRWVELVCGSFNRRYSPQSLLSLLAILFDVFSVKFSDLTA